jgi:hypothetical protein
MKAEQIIDRDTYREFRREWKILYNFISDEIRSSKREANALNWRKNSMSAEKHRARGQRETAALRRRANMLNAELAVAKKKRPFNQE